ncbi:hypothetical protein ACS3SW_18060 [Roseobacteraceae bacterium S113]
MAMGWAKASVLVLGVLALAGCAYDTRFDDPELIEQARYVHDGPPALTLYTMVSNNNGAGAHTSLMINASQRVIFDPAGSVSFTGIPENADILYGITPAYAKAYESAHARSTYHVVVQRIEVSAAVAERALQLALAAGPVPQSQCANSTSTLLSQLPGFESISSTWFPVNLSDDFGKVPGVTTRKHFEDDGNDKAQAVRDLEAQIRG